MTTTTNAQGEFTISGIPHGAKIVSLDATGIKAPNGHNYANFSGRLKIMQNVLNRPIRDYMLPRVNPAHIATVSSTASTTVSNSDIGVSMTVPAGVARKADNTAYTGPLSISMVPIDATPRELPELFNPSFLITLQPVDVRFSTPVPITFPNTDNLSAGSIVELFSLSERGGFERVGYGQVSSDGGSVTTIEGGIRSTTWHFMISGAPGFEGAGSGADDGGNNNTGGNGCDGSIICIGTGMLREEHTLPTFNVSNKMIRTTLAYTNTHSLNTLTLRPQYKYNLVPMGFQSSSLTPPPVMGVSFELEGRVSSEVFFNTIILGPANATESFDSIQQVSTEGLTTGMYEVTSRLNLITGPLNRRSRRMRKDTFFSPIIFPKTEFGWGWKLKELQRLYGMEGEVSSTSEKVLLVLGNFKYLVFTRNSDGSYTSPKGDYSTFKAVPGPVGGFTRSTKRGMTYNFNSKGFLTSRSDRHGRQTSYFYTSDNKLSRIEHDNGTETLLAYGSDGLVETITDPSGRVTRLTHNDRANLIRITDADNTSRQFAYGSNRALITQVDKLGRAKNYAYDTRGNVIHSVRADGSHMEVKSANSQIINEGLGTEANPYKLTLSGNNVSEFSDSRGRTTRWETNSFGAITKKVNRMGGERTWTLDENNNLMEFEDENGNTYRFTRDSYGNPLTVTSTRGTVTYTYMTNPADNFHQPISIRDERGNTTTLEYDTYGNIKKVSGPEGLVVNMSYRDKYKLETVENKATRSKSLYEYNSDDYITAVKDNSSQVLARFTYDNKGNVLTRSDALGNTTTLTYDALNRILTQTDAQSGVVTLTYDALGNLLSLNDQRGHTTSFAYDNMNRLTQRTDPLGRSESFAYDGDNNMIQRVDKNGATIAYEYDALDRMTRKSYPDGTHESYTYDAKGNLLSASDDDSMVSYTYDGFDRMITASTNGSSAQHDVTLNYTYDRGDNITILQDSLTGSSEKIHYEYNKSHKLTKVGHRSSTDSQHLRFRYDLIHRFSETIYPNSLKATFSYNQSKPLQMSRLQHGTTSDPDKVSSFSYTYNLNDYATGMTTSREL